MDPRLLPWALVLLGPALTLALAHAPAPEAREKLCGHHFVRALVRVCGGPRWSLETGRPVAGGDREWGLCSWVSKWGRCTEHRWASRTRVGLHMWTGVHLPAEQCVQIHRGYHPPLSSSVGAGARRVKPGSLENERSDPVFIYHFSILSFMHFCINFAF